MPLDDDDTGGPFDGPSPFVDLPRRGDRWAQRNGLEDDDGGIGEWDFGRDTTPIPPRGWLLGNIFCRRFVSSLVGPGAAGKTAVRLAQLLSVATGRELTGEHLFERGRVLIVSLEDDANELRRRLRAAMLHHNIDPEELVGWLFVSTPAPKGWKLAATVNGAQVERELAKRLEVSIRRRKIDLICLDPLVKAHAVDENDNGAVDFVMTILARIATEHDCALDAPQHTGKGNAAPGNADRARGGSAGMAAARLGYTLYPMSEKEAQKFGIEEHLRRVLVRMDSAKVNIAAPGTGTCWFRLLSVRIGNPSPLYPNGDDVQTVEPWTAPGTWAGASYAQLNAILDEIDEGLPNGSFFTSAPNGGARAAYAVVQKHLPEKTVEQAREIIQTWVRNRVLRLVDYDDPEARKSRKGLRLDPTRRPG